MAKPRVIWSCCLCLALTLSGVAVADGPERPARFVPNLDRQLVRVENPLDGSIWAAWTLRQGAHTDIAVSRLGTDGAWSEPLLIGADDGLNQLQPALAVDGYGTTYLAYAEQGTGRVFVTARGFSSPEWTTPAPISAVGLPGSAPALVVVANRKLVVGYVSDGRVSLRELPLLPPVILGNGNDGPDPLADSVWPPDPEDEQEDDDALGDENDAMDHEVEYTGPTRGPRSMR